MIVASGPVTVRRYPLGRAVTIHLPGRGELRVPRHTAHDLTVALELVLRRDTRSVGDTECGAKRNVDDDIVVAIGGRQYTLDSKLQAQQMHRSLEAILTKARARYSMQLLLAAAGIAVSAAITWTLIYLISGGR